METDSLKPISFPGQMYEVFAFIENDILLYRGLPTTGTEQQWRSTSTFGSIRKMSLKIGKINSNVFYTVVPYIDRWTKVSYGEILK